ncbi:RES family NAD+ phosphorylase [Flagellimonas marinaquae]|nr:RES family NAD+ phosphorylase [Allomuricauda aquimarina]
MNNNEGLCSECFEDQGLKLMSEKIGVRNPDICTNCLQTNGFKLNLEQLETLAYRFFVIGSIYKPIYGATPLIQFNQQQKTDIKLSESLNKDIKLFEKLLGIGFFHYGPRLWTVGEIEPLKMLQNKKTRKLVFDNIIVQYPTVFLDNNHLFYRIRTNPQNPINENEYDSTPYPGSGRLDSENNQVLYGSQDLEVCIHECRVSVEDDIYVATLIPKRSLKILDLTELLEEDCTEFESLDLAVQMLFLASKPSYSISKALSLYIREKGFDGIIYPSFFSLVRTGRVPFPTIYGISIRKIPEYIDLEKSTKIGNLAIFGCPIKDKKIQVKNINKLGLNQIKYDYQFGPAEIK